MPFFVSKVKIIQFRQKSIFSSRLSVFVISSVFRQNEILWSHSLEPMHIDCVGTTSLPVCVTSIVIRELF